MEIQLQNTNKVVLINGIPARIWEGYTAKGIKIHAFITRIGVEDDIDLTEFERDLVPAAAPTPAVELLPFQLLI